jgi:hypothetical protein
MIIISWFVLAVIILYRHGGIAPLYWKIGENWLDWHEGFLGWG